MKNYTGVICYSPKPFNALLSMVKGLRTSKVQYADNVAIRLPMADIIQKGTITSMKYNEETDVVQEAKVKVPFGDDKVAYKLRFENGKMFVVEFRN